jgi:anti-anti-sigma regulatory factor
VVEAETGQASDVRASVIGGTLLLAASGRLDADASGRLYEHLERARSGDRPLVLDLGATEQLGPEAVDMLRTAWRALGDRLRVVAPADSPAATALKNGGLRRFAVHGSLSGALTQAAA